MPLQVYLKAFKYANIYIITVLAGFLLGVFNGLLGLNSEIIATISYVTFVLPVMVYSQSFHSMGLMLIGEGGVLFPSDAAMIAGHFIFIALFYGSYLAVLIYRENQKSRELTTINDD